jgi:ubiquinone/menaquinone biosynthesis C-methylase UbiE
MSSNLEKYTSANPLQQYLINRFLLGLSDIYKGTDSNSLLEVGTGEGHVLDFFSEKNILPEKTVGVDISTEAILYAKKRALPVVFREASALTLPFEDSSFDTVMCLEVLEHIVDFERALTEIIRVSKKYVLLSVPWEPWFSYANALRGKNVKKFGRDPEHVNVWSKKSFHSLVHREGFKIKKHLIVFPWQVAMLERH